MNKIPFVTKEQLDEITKTYPTPFHLYDEKGIRENVKALKDNIRLRSISTTREGSARICRRLRKRSRGMKVIKSILR